MRSLTPSASAIENGRVCAMERLRYLFQLPWCQHCLFLGQGNPYLKTVTRRGQWHRWSKSHEETRGGLLPTPRANLASRMRCQSSGASYPGSRQWLFWGHRNSERTLPPGMSELSNPWRWPGSPRSSIFLMQTELQH